MSNQIYTRRLVAARLNGAGDQVVYTAPAGQTTILRDVVLHSLGDLAQAVALYIVSGGVIFQLYRVIFTSTQGTAHLDLRQELRPGDEVHLTAAQGAATALLTGYVFPP